MNLNGITKKTELDLNGMTKKKKTLDLNGITKTKLVLDGTTERKLDQNG